MSFKTYVLARRRTDNPLGDFIADVKSDPAFPDPRSWNDLQTYLVGRGACQEAIEAAQQVWHQFEARR